MNPVTIFIYFVFTFNNYKVDYRYTTLANVNYLYNKLEQNKYHLFVSIILPFNLRCVKF